MTSTPVIPAAPNLDIQIACSEQEGVPNPAEFSHWVSAALDAANESLDYEISLRIVDNAESQAINKQFRGKDAPTNVLSFPADLSEAESAQLAQPFLGDLLFAEPVIRQETQDQHKTLSAHWAHLTIHGVLHLLGFDHETAIEAEEMETLEIAILATLGLANPYVDVFLNTPDRASSDNT